MTLGEVAEFLRVPPDALAEVAEDLPAFEIGGQVRVRLNRREVLACDTSAQPKLAGCPRRGYIALRMHTGKADFRSLRIKDGAE
jgi:hypothetical protein